MICPKCGRIIINNEICTCMKQEVENRKKELQTEFHEKQTEEQINSFKESINIKNKLQKYEKKQQKVEADFFDFLNVLFMIIKNPSKKDIWMDFANIKNVILLYSLGLLTTIISFLVLFNFSYIGHLLGKVNMTWGQNIFISTNIYLCCNIFTILLKKKFQEEIPIKEKIFTIGIQKLFTIPIIVLLTILFPISKIIGFLLLFAMIGIQIYFLYRSFPEKNDIEKLKIIIFYIIGNVGFILLFWFLIT